MGGEKGREKGRRARYSRRQKKSPEGQENGWNNAGGAEGGGPLESPRDLGFGRFPEISVGDFSQKCPTEWR